MPKMKQKMFESRNDPALEGVNVTKIPLRTNLAVAQRNPQNPASWGNVGRNELCPCGSNKKFKYCHGAFK